MLSNVEKKLEETAKANPLTKAEKNLLWAKIESNLKQNQLLTFFAFKPKFAFASIMATILVIGSAVAVGASNDAGPGDILYSIDIAVERVQLALSKEENKDNLRLIFAQERLKEAQRALAFQNGNNSESITISTSTEDNFKRIRKIDQTLPVALERLEKTKELFEQKGNEEATERVNEIIENLTNLAQNHVSELDELEIGMHNNERRQEVRAFGKKIKAKFKLNNSEDVKSENVEKVVICHIPLGNPDNAHTIEVAESAVQAHLDHGDTLGPCEDQGDEDNATSTPDTTAPVISNISSSVTTNTADIIWNTYELSNSKVWYSTTTPIVLGSSLLIESANLVASHAISLSGLNASTTYYFIVGSIDEFNNEATSTELLFTTL